MVLPFDLLYHAEHLWVSPLTEGGTFIGVTSYAVASLGAIAGLDLCAVGTVLRRGEAFGGIESAKTVSDLIAPVSGVLLERNEALLADPAPLNADPYRGNWLVRVRVADRAELSQLLTAGQYVQLVAA